ncbi:hypothetical protein CCAX7_16890 [Capsulimonas corticalis]|uniref:Uncharacterized protein n=1 Tax=Capsulimonas corticalis TaxID=2219043 RepID=A0A402CYV2_9BACT|nr:hypothetical protein [Capsulimonas corticalis]BDI29638.1 hypothetical protein CCAX7_16890 [Capsulimonas corticalis]
MLKRPLKYAVIAALGAGALLPIAYAALKPALKHAMIIPALVFKTTLPVDAVAITPDGKFVWDASSVK